MIEIGEAPVTVTGGALTAQAEINGRRVRMIVDTGSISTLLFRDSAEQLGLPLHTEIGLKVSGGGPPVTESAEVETLQVGTLVSKNVNLVVTGRNPGSHGQGLVGADLLLQADVEVDVPEGKVRFFKPVNCAGDQVVYWGAAYAVSPMLGAAGGRVEVMVSLNGAKVRALLDTGVGSSVVGSAAAARAGVAPAPRAVSASDSPQAGQGDVGVVPTFAFGDETIHNARLEIASLFGEGQDADANLAGPGAGGAQMLLGADFFRSHRVYIARSQRKVYVTYIGGPVFATTPAPAATP